MIRKVLIFLLLALVVIQFFHPAKNISTAAQPNALGAKYPIPEGVDTVMQKACYDCHSNNTRYPWYFHVQPSAWFLYNHIRDGKRHFNFDAFLTYSKDKQVDKLKDLIDMVDSSDMPLSSYTWMHADARLNGQQRAAIVAWAKHLREQIKQ